MTRRSVNNERYTTEDGIKGVTRKSASKAKPVKEAGGTIYEAPPAKKTRKQRRQEEVARREKLKARNENRPGAPQNESSITYETKNAREIKQWRKRWWVCIILGVVMVLLSFVAKNINGLLFYINIVAAYLMIGVALYIEFAKIGRLRKNDEKASMEKISSKQLKHQMEAERLEEARRAAKRSRGIRIGKNKEADIENYPMDESEL